MNADVATREQEEEILAIWKTFARTKVFAFRGVTEAAYELFSRDYFASIIARSNVRVLQADGVMHAAIVYEKVPESEATVVHFAWTAKENRNCGLQVQLWTACGLGDDALIFISHLTVVSEQLAAKNGWLFNPFVLYKQNHKGD
jgi:hypothetical protein